MADHIGKLNEICSVISDMLAEISLNSFFHGLFFITV